MQTATTASALCKCSSIPSSYTYNTIGPPIHLKKKTKERHARKRLFHGARCQVLHHHQQHGQSFSPAMSRRWVCMGSGATAALWMLLIGTEESQAKDIQVGSYLPLHHPKQALFNSRLPTKTPLLCATWKD